jgi:hypothetical protein
MLSTPGPMPKDFAHLAMSARTRSRWDEDNAIAASGLHARTRNRRRAGRTLSRALMPPPQSSEGRLTQVWVAPCLEGLERALCMLRTGRPRSRCLTTPSSDSRNGLAIRLTTFHARSRACDRKCRSRTYPLTRRGHVRSYRGCRQGGETDASTENERRSARFTSTTALAILHVRESLGRWWQSGLVTACRGAGLRPQQTAQAASVHGHLSSRQRHSCAGRGIR